MTVKIIIKRRVPEGTEKELGVFLKEMRNRCNDQPGYISGETYQRVDHPQEILVISNWQSIETWNRWVASAERTEVQNKIDFLLGERTDYEVYQYL